MKKWKIWPKYAEKQGFERTIFVTSHHTRVSETFRNAQMLLFIAYYSTTTVDPKENPKRYENISLKATKI